MMPYCQYGRCKHVSDKKLGSVITGAADGYGNEWPEVVYVCEKHYKKVLKLLNLRIAE